MLRTICFSLVLSSCALATADQLGKAHHTPIELTSSHGLVPSVFIEKTADGWSVNVDLEAQTNFTRSTWLKITNRIGSKLQLWTTNGVEIVSTNTDLLHVASLPLKTTVREIMSGVPRRWRVNQWLHTQVGAPITTTGFSLRDYFDFSGTNDVVLQLTPLIYRVETNMETAHLVEFPRVKLKLKPNGDVQKLE